MNRTALIVALLVSALVVGAVLYGVGSRDPIDRHVRDLQSPRRYVRAVAAYRLGLLKDRAARAAPALVELLTDRQPVGADATTPDQMEALRTEIIKHLADNPRAKALAERILRTSPGYEANRAILAIGSAAVPALITKLRPGRADDLELSPQLRLMLYELLAGIKDPRGLQALAQITLTGEDPAARVTAFRYLLRFGHEAANIAVRCLDREKGLYAVVPDPRLTKALLRTGKRAVAPLEKGLNADSADVRRQATRLLCDLLRLDSAHPARELLMIPLEQALESKDTRAGAHNLAQLADALEETKDPRAVEPLCKAAIISSSERIREVALTVLRRIGRKEQTVKLMAQLLEASDPDVAGGAGAALRIYEGRPVTQPEPPAESEGPGPPPYTPEK